MFEKKLRQEMDRRFNGEELRTLCANLGLDYDDDLIGRTKDARILSLVQIMQQRGSLPLLIEELSQERPLVDWQALLSGRENDSQIIYRRDQLLILIQQNRGVQLGLGVFFIVLVAGLLALLSGRDGDSATVTPTTANMAGAPASTDTPTATRTPVPETPVPEAPSLPADTETPTPTSTSMLTPAADVVIIEFEGVAERDIRLARRIEDDLRRTLSLYDLDDINISVQSEPVNNIAEAQKIAEESGSKVVVWGWVDAIGVNIRIYLNDEKQARKFTNASELPLSNLL